MSDDIIAFKVPKRGAGAWRDFIVDVHERLIMALRDSWHYRSTSGPYGWTARYQHWNCGRMHRGGGWRRGYATTGEEENDGQSSTHHSAT